MQSSRRSVERTPRPFYFKLPLFYERNPGGVKVDGVI